MVLGQGHVVRAKAGEEREGGEGEGGEEAKDREEGGGEKRGERGEQLPRIGRMEEGELVQTIKDFIISRGGCDFGGSEFTQLYEEKEGARDAMKRVRKRGGLAALCARYPTELTFIRDEGQGRVPAYAAPKRCPVGLGSAGEREGAGERTGEGGKGGEGEEGEERREEKKEAERGAGWVVDLLVSFLEDKRSRTAYVRKRRGGAGEGGRLAGCVPA
eukprot:2368521-Rhodomonas_salina.2